LWVCDGGASLLCSNCIAQWFRQHAWCPLDKSKIGWRGVDSGVVLGRWLHALDLPFVPREVVLLVAAIKRSVSLQLAFSSLALSRLPWYLGSLYALLAGMRLVALALFSAEIWVSEVRRRSVTVDVLCCDVSQPSHRVVASAAAAVTVRYCRRRVRWRRCAGDDGAHAAAAARVVDAHRPNQSSSHHRRRRQRRRHARGVGPQPHRRRRARRHELRAAPA
jgi:hypothetical protein